MSHAPQAIEILDVILSFSLHPPVVSGETITPEKKITHFRFWLDVLFRYFFPVFFPKSSKEVQHLQPPSTPKPARTESSEESKVRT